MKFNFFKKANSNDEKDLYENQPLTKDNAINYILNFISRELKTENRIEEKTVYLPKIDLRIQPIVNNADDRSAFLDFFLYCPKWGQVVYDCCAAASGSMKKAVDMAVISFLFSIMEIVLKMELEGEKNADDRISTEFAGKTHNWQVYLSNDLQLGNPGTQRLESPTFWWNLLKDEIIKRLGNQKLCYVKVYGYKTRDTLEGECRIDDVKSDELSNIVAKEVEKWEATEFESHKMFFLIRQEEGTVTPYPYFGLQGERELTEKVKAAATIMGEADTEEKYNRLMDRLINELGDKTLAQECFSFLPEICAERAFQDDLTYSETINIMIEGKEKVTCFKNQLADYHRLGRAIFDLFNSGYFGDKTDEVYRRLVGMSATANLVDQVRKNGSHPISAFAILYQASNDFEIR